MGVHQRMFLPLLALDAACGGPHLDYAADTDAHLSLLQRKASMLSALREAAMSADAAGEFSSPTEDVFLSSYAKADGLKQGQEFQQQVQNDYTENGNFGGGANAERARMVERVQRLFAEGDDGDERSDLRSYVRAADRGGEKRPEPSGDRMDVPQATEHLKRLEALHRALAELEALSEDREEDTSHPDSAMDSVARASGLAPGKSDSMEDTFVKRVDEAARARASQADSSGSKSIEAPSSAPASADGLGSIAAQMRATLSDRVSALRQHFFGDDGDLREAAETQLVAVPPPNADYVRDTGLLCGRCGGGNDLSLGSGGATFDSVAQEKNVVPHCGGVCWERAECAGFSFSRASGHCYYRADTGCQATRDEDHDCFTKSDRWSPPKDEISANSSEGLEPDETEDGKEKALSEDHEANYKETVAQVDDSTQLDDDPDKEGRADKEDDMPLEATLLGGPVVTRGAPLADSSENYGQAHNHPKGDRSAQQNRGNWHENAIEDSVLGAVDLAKSFDFDLNPPGTRGHLSLGGTGSVNRAETKSKSGVDVSGDFYVVNVKEQKYLQAGDDSVSLRTVPSLDELGDVPENVQWRFTTISGIPGPYYLGSIGRHSFLTIASSGNLELRQPPSIGRAPGLAPLGWHIERVEDKDGAFVITSPRKRLLEARSGVVTTRPDDISAADSPEGAQWQLMRVLDSSRCNAYMVSSGCGWTARWNCPGQPAGSLGSAEGMGGRDSVGFTCCCGYKLYDQALPESSSSLVKRGASDPKAYTVDEVLGEDAATTAIRAAAEKPIEEAPIEAAEPAREELTNSREAPEPIVKKRKESRKTDVSPEILHEDAGSSEHDELVELRRRLEELEAAQAEKMSSKKRIIAARNKRGRNGQGDTPPKVSAGVPQIMVSGSVLPDRKTKMAAEMVKRIESLSLELAEMKHMFEGFSAPQGKVFIDGESPSDVEGRARLQAIGFVRTHRTGASVMVDIIHRLGKARHLSFFQPASKQPKIAVEQDGGLGWPGLFPGPDSAAFNGAPMQQFDVICDSAVFNEGFFRDYLRPAPFFFTVLREPSQQIASAFAQYDPPAGVEWAHRIQWLERLGGGPPEDEEALVLRARFQNPQAHDLGWYERLAGSRDFDLDDQAVARWLAELHVGLGLVILAEHLDEGLVLLRRRLGLRLAEVAHLRPEAPPRQQPSEEQRDKLRDLLHVDAQLYDHFNRSFWREWEAAGNANELETELEELRHRSAELQGARDAAFLEVDESEEADDGTAAA